MKVVGLQAMVKAFIRQQNRWAVWVLWSHQTYEAVKASPSGAELPSAVEYVHKILGVSPKEHSELLTEVWKGQAVVFFDRERFARNFFARFPDGALVSAELYNNNGEFVTDNT